MIERKITALAAVALAGCVSYKKPLPPLATPPPEARFTFSEKARQARLTTVVVDLPLGHKYGEVGWGTQGSCYRRQPLVNSKGRFELEPEVYVSAFGVEMKKRGYPVEEEIEMFKHSKERVADLQVGARVVGAVLNECFPKYGDNQLLVRGSAHLKVEWSIYSTVEKKIIFTTTTEGSTRGEITSEVGERGLLVAAFADATRFLASSSAYRDVIDAPVAPEVPAGAATGEVGVRRVVEFTGPLNANIDTIRRAVATVTANKGSGSGFVISADGVVVTAEHVVSGSRFVKVETGAGRECYGEVTASSKKRDLALIQLDCKDLTALPLARRAPVEGAEVYAIGTPLTEKLKFSVTKGVVSGIRQEEGLDWIQSDVTVLPGSSGGPLLDASGNVVGVTSIMIVAREVPVGMNFFIPVADLARHLPLRIE